MQEEKNYIDCSTHVEYDVVDGPEPSSNNTYIAMESYEMGSIDAMIDTCCTIFERQADMISSPSPTNAG